MNSTSPNITFINALSERKKNESFICLCPQEINTAQMLQKYIPLVYWNKMCYSFYCLDGLDVNVDINIPLRMTLGQKIFEFHNAHIIASISVYCC